MLTSSPDPSPKESTALTNPISQKSMAPTETYDSDASTTFDVNVVWNGDAKGAMESNVVVESDDSDDNEVRKYIHYFTTNFINVRPTSNVSPSFHA